MKHACLLLLALSFATQVDGDDVRQRHRQLWDQYAVQLLEPALPNFGVDRFFLPHTKFAASDESTQRKADEYASQLLALARAASREDVPLAYQLLHEAAYFGRDSLADKIVNAKTKEPNSRLATNPHPRLGWKRREYFRVYSEHYQVICRDEQAGLEITKRLETLYSVWRQLFVECWSNEARLRSALKQGKTLVPPAQRLHRVVLFSSKQEYTAFLRKSQPRIGITKGFYDIDARTSYFFAGEGSTLSTQLHEVTHQLFQEVQKTPEHLAMPQNFWVVEGIAMYMESLQQFGPVARVGGLGARRLQFARYRRLQEDFYVPLQGLVKYGRDQLQRDQDIRRIYSQSAGLTHFLIEFEQGRYRKSLVQYLKKIYQGRDRVDSLSRLTETNTETLDGQYKKFLSVGDEELSKTMIPPDSLTALCLGNTGVTSRGLGALPRQGKLEWLDLSGLPVNREGLAFVAATTTLKQLSFDGCTQISNDVVRLISQNRDLEELDLSGTEVTDEGLKHLANHPSLQMLWVTATQLTDESVPILSSMRSLRTLDCEGTRISAESLETLRRENPLLSIE